MRCQAGERAERVGGFVVAALIVVLVVPLTVSSVRSYRYLLWADATEAATRSRVEGTGFRPPA